MKKTAFLFLAGGTIYPGLEVLTRGHTDISMAFAGGVCLCLIDRVCNGHMRFRPLLERCCAGSGIITGVEFTVGVVVNIMLKMNVWDYSALPLNVLGQICLPFSLLWLGLSLPAMGIGRVCEKLRFLRA